MGRSTVQIRISGPVPDGLTVIETMRAEADGTIRLWPLHLVRLQRDCAAVDFPLDHDRVAAVIADLPQGTALRVRLTVDAVGTMIVMHQPLPRNPDSWIVAISPVRLDSRDPWLGIKTSHRPVYDAARAGMPDNCDEVILLNERDELCEGTITNLFLRRGDKLLTPPLQSGLLPGVMRQALLDSGQATEAVLYPDDLQTGQLIMGNALRGLIDARLV